MELRFKPQQYQEDATQALVNVFRGQIKGQSKSLLDRDGLFEQHAFANRKLDLDYGTLLNNLQEVQRQNDIPVNKKLEGRPDFSVEMETGTGKTYVYTKTMFELNRAYGWQKFIIMVPSIAIREGVYKSLQMMTTNHFQTEYGKNMRFFIYDSKQPSNLTNIKSFAQKNEIQVMIMNYQAFTRPSKANRKIYYELDELQSQRPIDVIQQTRPILIIDEPQKFGPKTEQQLEDFKPLFTIRYSATHQKEFNKVYSLDALDAYQQKLVKKISVKGIETKGSTGTHGYLFLDRLKVSEKEAPKAYIELEVAANNSAGIAQKTRLVSEGDDLHEISGELEQYRGFVVREIDASTNHVQFTNGTTLTVGEVTGEVDETHIRRLQIREAIESHLSKERELYQYYGGIKVLTLFFINEVAKYRSYDENGNLQKGEYEQMFEEEYRKAIKQMSLLDPEYEKYLNRDRADEVHNGYFSIDKKGKYKNPDEKGKEKESNDVDAYELIMKDKERLLSFEEPTRFVFSHSALREGWDNPNIFQICTLRHSSSEVNKHQEVGRGLRVAVNSHGERMDWNVLGDDFFDVNNLTVIANESYDSFARDLQKEIWESLSDRPTVLTSDVLKDRQVKNENGETFTFDSQKAQEFVFDLVQKGYLEKKGEVTEKFVNDRAAGKLEFPEEFESFKESLTEIIDKIHTTNTYQVTENEFAKNVNEREVKPNNNFYKKEFQDLWKSLKQKTIYEVKFDDTELIKQGVEALNTQLKVSRPIVQITAGEQREEIERSTVQEKKGWYRTKDDNYEEIEANPGDVKYDLIGQIAEEAHLTRQTVGQILSHISESQFSLFQINPEQFIRESARILKEQKAAMLINQVSYRKIDQEYEDEIFTINNLRGELDKDVIEAQKHIHDYVPLDSDIERKFAQDLDVSENSVVVYAKMPRGFKIPTPVGDYSPDWAIVFDENKVRNIYFIAETKGSMNTLQLKGIEKQKIEYAHKHFAKLSEDNVNIYYDVVTSYEKLMNKVMS